MIDECFRIILVGPGLIGKRHAALISAEPRAQLAAIVAPDSEENRSYAQMVGSPFFADLTEAIAKTAADGVIIASPNEFHASQASICILARLPVLVEKPITATLLEARELVKLAAKTGASVLIGHHRHHSPLLEDAVRLVQSGRLGRIVSLMGSAQFSKPTQYFLDGPWRTKFGGGPVLINLIHEIGICRSLVGEIEEVHAFSSSSIRNFEVEDTLSVNFRFCSGALGTFLLSDCAATPMSWEQTSQENLTYPTYPDMNCYSIAGTRGSLHFPTMRIFSYGSEARASWWEPFYEEVRRPQREDPLQNQLAHFLDVIGGTALPIVSERDGYENMRVIEAIQMSVRDGCMVSTKAVA